MRGRILVCDVQHPFAEDPWAPFVKTLVHRLGDAGFAVDLSRIPGTLASPGPSLDDALVWRLLDLDRGGGEGVDLLLALRFPAWVGRHPRKVVWTLPDELTVKANAGKANDGKANDGKANDEAIRFDLGHRGLGEARRVFAATPGQREALARQGVEADLLTPPPLTPLPGTPTKGPEDPWPSVLDALTWIL